MADDKRDLLLAILAMDSYNQGYKPGYDHGSRQIGGAVKFIPENVDETSWEAAGFYAAAYDLPDGATVISYRGTDDLNLFSSANDIVNGWAIGAGAQTGQSIMALDFYEKVTNKSVFETSDANVILTGHSLGGGERIRCR